MGKNPSRKIDLQTKIFKLLTYNEQAKWSSALRIIILVIALAGIVIALKLVKSAVDPYSYAKEGYLGILISTLVGSSTILLPAPNIAFIFLGGVLFNPIFSGIVGGIGWGLGEMTGYWVGRLNYRIAIKSRSLENRFIKAKSKIEKWGFRVIFFAAIIPNPFFDVIGIAAGVLNISLFRFLVPCLLGKIICALVISLISYFFFR